MKSSNKQNAAMFMLLIFLVFGCSKPESQLVGAWKNEQTASTIEFYENKTGVIRQRNEGGVPATFDFKWTMPAKDQVKVEVILPGTHPGPSAVGKLEGKEVLVLDQDRFRKIK